MRSFAEPKISVVVLAAGNSSRMNGVQKQLLKIEGKTLLRRSVETALQIDFFSTVVVLGSNQDKLRQDIKDLPLLIVLNDKWEIGISASIKAALGALSIEKPDAIIFMLCDQPLVSSETLKRIRNVFKETNSPIIASQYKNTFGVPALFSRDFFYELENLQGDEGAKKIILKNFDKTVFVDAPEAGFDVDTAQDYEKIKYLILPS